MAYIVDLISTSVPFRIPFRGEQNRNEIPVAQDSELINRGEINFTILNVSKIVDKKRIQIEKFLTSDESEDNIEKIDAVLAGVSILMRHGELRYFSTCEPSACPMSDN